ncbi:protein trichome birefringence-like 43 [Macadamia integrifolia]|uniref:protein trichome birefringence-like 43 n=1 Tax=Macadamia integrifolia TaxID=60698 RepID=UPI001C52CE03|nr:protein trichome birefringence-like 43 [Macadamia integrifolia]
MALSFHAGAEAFLAVVVMVVVALLQPINVVEAIIEKSGGCDYFQGSWVFDVSYPLYDTNKCPFIEKEFNCQKNGRPDKLYQKYKWKPSDCNLPRFDGQDFLKRNKGKKIMFVGDSLSLNQWQSLTCMLYTSVPNAKYTDVRRESLSIFTFTEYNVSVMFFRYAFLVDIVAEKIGRVLKLDSIEGSKIWQGADTLIFNSWHWWLHTGRKQPWDFIQEGNKYYKDMDRLVAYEKGLSTWAKWIDSNVDPKRTNVFFQGVSPDHTNGNDWNEPQENCGTQKQPVSGSRYPGGPHPAEIVVKKVLSRMVKPVCLLDVTLLSQLRKDGHPSVYGYGGHLDMDCSHWCLAGVPDTWNQILYAAVLSQH